MQSEREQRFNIGRGTTSCGSGLARDNSTAVIQIDGVVCIVSKPAPTEHGRIG